jgi:hypothetical protein
MQTNLRMLQHCTHHLKIALKLKGFALNRSLIGMPITKSNTNDGRAV